MSFLTINAFACADSVLIPVQAAYLPVKGLEHETSDVDVVVEYIGSESEDGVFNMLHDLDLHIATQRLSGASRLRSFRTECYINCFLK